MELFAVSTLRVALRHSHLYPNQRFGQMDKLPIHSQSAPHRPTPQALKAYGCGTSFAWHNPFLDCLRQPENEKPIFRLPPIQIKNDIYNISQNTTAAQAKSSTTANINSPTLVDAFMLCTSIISTAMMCHKIIA